MSVHIEDTVIAEKSKIIFDAILTHTHNYFIRQFINDLLERTTDKSFMGGFVFGAPGDYERLKRKLLSGFHPDHNKHDPHCTSIFTHIKQLHKVLKGEDPHYRARRVKENLGANFPGYLPFKKPVEPTSAVVPYTSKVEPAISPVLLGKLVILRGLKTRGALNGMVAQVTGFDASKGRYYVTLPTSEQYLLRPENLRECQFDVHNSNIEPTRNNLSSQGQDSLVCTASTIVEHTNAHDDSTLLTGGIEPPSPPKDVNVPTSKRKRKRGKKSKPAKRHCPWFDKPWFQSDPKLMKGYDSRARNLWTNGEVTKWGNVYTAVHIVQKENPTRSELQAELTRYTNWYKVIWPQKKAGKSFQASGCDIYQTIKHLLEALPNEEPSA